jgi:hypothetical protein
MAPAWVKAVKLRTKIGRHGIGPGKRLRRTLERRRGRRLVLCMLLPWSVLAGTSEASDRARAFVSEVDAFFKTSERTRVFLLWDSTRNHTTDTIDNEFGLHLDLTLKPAFRSDLQGADWARNRYLWTRVGYQQLGSPDSRGFGPTERRAIAELTGRIPLPQEVWLVNRGRIDLRDLGGELSKRARFRVGIEREFNLGDVENVWYAQGEIFYDTRYGTWHRQLYQVGAEIEISKHWRIEPYFSRQNDSRSDSGNVDTLGLALKYFH